MLFAVRIRQLVECRPRASNRGERLGEVDRNLNLAWSFVELDARLDLIADLDAKGSTIRL